MSSDQCKLEEAKAAWRDLGGIIISLHAVCI